MSTENYKTLLKEIFKNLNKWKDINVYSLKTKYHSDDNITQSDIQVESNSYQNSNSVSCRNSKTHFKIKGNQIAKTILKKK